MGWKETAAVEMSGKDGVALVPAVHIIIGSAEDRSAPGTEQLDGLAEIHERRPRLLAM
jgi:hypothetical protein